ncbi:MAG TPA: hypothetical protein VGQ94_08355 [Terriglobales bacterium]|nr:hypothetical protein [Terriglobales bacterium]
MRRFTAIPLLALLLAATFAQPAMALFHADGHACCPPGTTAQPVKHSGHHHHAPAAPSSTFSSTMPDCSRCCPCLAPAAVEAGVPVASPVPGAPQILRSFPISLAPAGRLAAPQSERGPPTASSC